MATLFQVHFFSRWPNQSFRKKTLPTTWMSKRNVNWKLGRCRRKLFGRRELDRFPVRHQRRCHRIASSVSGEDAFFFILYFNSISFRFFSATNCWAMAAGCDDVETVALFFISGRFFFLQKQQQQQTTKPSNFIGQFDVETNQSAIHFQTLLWQHSRFSLANDGATNQSAPWKSSTRGRSNKRRTIYWSTTKK